MKRLSFLFFLIQIILFSCNKEKEFSQTRFLLGTICEVKIVSFQNKDFVNKIFEEIFSEVEKINKTFGYSKESEIYRINSNAGIKPVIVSGEVFDIIKKSVEIGDLTNGCFDITSGILSSIWKFEDFSKEIKFNLPSQQEIKKVLSLVGYKKIILDEEKNSIFLPKKGMKINLGGIAKGYAIKRTKEILESHNFEKFLINFGGDIYVKNKKNSKPWRIAIQHPRKKSEFLCILELNTVSCVTSGDYERFFILENKRYHHIFDPKTGYPVQNGVVSVTVLCEDPILADALATGIFVMGEKEGMKLAEKLNIDTIIVVEEGNKLKVYTTEKLKNLKFNL